ncbi:DUF2975 domain-containing protein [Maribellus sediminis]|uniref:DUF2975 domain-containing protein n=1 Tax=Maribellus sediminis TaxID=2696285 RepID=UPI0014321E7C|nr:DUF2975 domain-containing protein [Maribellus sediminis]
MEMKVNTRTEQILTVLKILAWVAFFGFAVSAVLFLSSYISGFWNSINIFDIKEAPNLLQLRQENFGLYTILMAFSLIMALLKAIVWWMVAKIIDKIKIDNPFSMEVVHQLEYISYSLFTIWVLSVTGGGFIAWLGDKAGHLNDSWNKGPFLFMAGLVFVISQIFKRGVEIQSENDLTV